MTFILALVATLTLISHAASAPSRVPACIERLNPFDWTCNENVQAETGVVSLAGRDESAVSSDSRMIQFADTFTQINQTTSSGNLPVSFPGYPQGLALSYPGFAYSSIKSSKLLMPSPPEVLLTDPSIQSTTGRQPGIIRSSNTSSFDLRTLRFACAYRMEDGTMELPSCLITLACKPKTMKDDGIPSGHRPTPRSMVQSTFEFDPTMDQSSLFWPNPPEPNPAPEPHVKATVYARADLGDGFYDLDHCSIILQQFAASSNASDISPAVLIDDVVGVAYYGEDSTN